MKAKATEKTTSRPPAKAGGKAAATAPVKSKTDAKSKGLAAVDALLGAPRGAPRAPAAPQRSGGSRRDVAVPAGAKTPPAAAAAKIPAEAAATGEASRFERSIARAAKGEPGPIRLADLSMDPAATSQAVASGRVALYKKILQSNPSAQPGRPLVNVVGTSDVDLKYQLLSLHELVLAARDLGREAVQVLLVRLDSAAAADLLASPAVAAPLPAAQKPLTPRQIAAMNGFLELPLGAIIRSENLRQAIDQTAPEFLNLVESLRTVGLQNPPVVEVREREGHATDPLFVCVSGHRRLLALEALGVASTTCALKTFTSERHRALAGLAENINREDLHFLDKADAYGLLVKQGMTAQEISALLDADVRTVGKYIRASAWDLSVKQRIRDLGGQATTRFMLNMLAAGERTTAELHALIDRFVAAKGAPAKPARGVELRNKLNDFYSLSDVSHDQRLLVEKALRFLGYLR